MKNTALLLAEIAGLLIKYKIAITDFSMEYICDNGVIIKVIGDEINE